MQFPILNDKPKLPAGQKYHCIIIDLDGTLNVMSKHPGYKFNWTRREETSALLKSQAANWPLISLTNALFAHLNESVVFIVMTARPDDFKEATEWWLSTHKVKYHTLMMRDSGDVRSDAEVKSTLIDRVKDLHTIWFALDDRKTVVDMMRARGILTLQVNDNCS